MSNRYRIAETETLQRTPRRNKAFQKVYRLFYTIEESDVVVVVVDLRPRQDAHHD